MRLGLCEVVTCMVHKLRVPKGFLPYSSQITTERRGWAERGWGLRGDAWTSQCMHAAGDSNNST